ncbi:MAG TPA: DUF1360 domain-containing protein [Solirubrobacteraceae bacterium]|jgi:hypothetical protein|nr:DUF1360 domain-containing protein [Solirubrobacteraceae bacterium]
MTALREKPVQLGLKPPGDNRPLGSYAVLMSAFGTFAAAFAVWFSRSERELPDDIRTRDLVLLTVASHKLARLLSKDRITSPIRAPFTEPRGEGGPGEVEETSRGQGLRRAIGQLLLCPYCLGMWTSAGFVAGLLTFPRFTRWVASVFTIFFGSELLQIAYKKAEDLV